MGTPIKRVVVLGAGAMGAFYASRFFELDKDNTFLVADGDRYDRLKKDGLEVNGKRYDFQLIRPSDKVPPADFLLVAVKGHQLEQAIEDARNNIGPETLVLSVMNGVDSEKQLGTAYGPEKVLHALAVAIDAVKEGARVSLTSTGKIIFGEENNKTISDKVKRVQDLFDRAGLNHETPEDMVRALWWKFMINVGINQVSAILRAPYGTFQKSREALELMKMAMREAVAVAEKEGVDLKEKDIESWVSALHNLGPHGKTSMVQDIEAKRKTEVEMFAGKVIELGRKHDVQTPFNDALFRFIKVMEQSY